MTLVEQLNKRGMKFKWPVLNVRKVVRKLSLIKLETECRVTRETLRKEKCQNQTA